MPLNARVRDRHWKVWVSLFTRQSKSWNSLQPTTTRGRLRVRKWVANEVNKCPELPRCFQSQPLTAAGRICWSTLIRVKYCPTDSH